MRKQKPAPDFHLSLAVKAALCGAALIAIVAASSDIARAAATNGKIVYSASDGDYEIFTVNPDGTDTSQLTNNTDYDDLPNWSDDGTQIAFISNRGANGDIYKMNADGTNQVRLTTSTGYDTHPDWSPDGQIAFSSNRDGNSEIYKMNADGSDQVRLTNDPSSDDFPYWSPDGLKIAFISTRSPDTFTDIYVMNADGTSVTNVSNTPDIWDYIYGWSPDGSRLVFSSDRDGNQEIYIMDADGSDVVRLTTDPATDDAAAWAPDGMQIAFVSNRVAGENKVFTMDVDGSDVEQVTSGTTDGAPHWQPIITSVVTPSDPTPGSAAGLGATTAARASLSGESEIPAAGTAAATYGVPILALWLLWIARRRVLQY